MNTKSSNTNNSGSEKNTIMNSTVNDSKLAQFNLFFEYDNSVSDVRKNTRNRAIR